MKRLALALGSLVLSTQIAGCGGSGGNAPTTGPALQGLPSEDPNLPAEVREQYRREEEVARKAKEREAKTAKPANR